MAAKKGKKVIRVDFTGVEAGGGGKLLPEGPYKFEVVDLEQKEGEESGQPYLAFELAVVDGEFEGTKAWDNMSLQPQSLWKLRGFMEAGGLPTEDGVMDIDPDELIGVVVTANVIHEEYKGKTKHRIDSYDLPEAEEATTTTTSAVRKKKLASNDGGDDEPQFKVKQRVSFKDGKKTLTGVITKLEDGKADVRVGSDEYEMDVGDLEAA